VKRKEASMLFATGFTNLGVCQLLTVRYSRARSATPSTTGSAAFSPTEYNHLWLARGIPRRALLSMP
jgi:hypothetical protein